MSSERRNLKLRRTRGRCGATVLIKKFPNAKTSRQLHDHVRNKVRPIITARSIPLEPSRSACDAELPLSSEHGYSPIPLRTISIVRDQRPCLFSQRIRARTWTQGLRVSEARYWTRKWEHRDLEPEEWRMAARKGTVRRQRQKRRGSGMDTRPGLQECR